MQSESRDPPQLVVQVTLELRALGIILQLYNENLEQLGKYNTQGLRSLTWV